MTGYTMKDEAAAIAAIEAFAGVEEKNEAHGEVVALLSSQDPVVDIPTLFALFDRLYFRSLLLARVEVIWSARLTLCAGTCELVKDGQGRYRRVRLKLSEPLLKFRPREDVVNTLLHEAIHAYFFITTSWQHSRGDDGTGHGAGFLLLADAINNHGGYGVSVYHTFHDEVDSYRTHVWHCDGPCRTKPPYFGVVKRSMNRPPGKHDTWYTKHQDDCGGNWTKMAEPEKSREQVARMNGMQRAGLQKNKLDAWMNNKQSKTDSNQLPDGQDHVRATPDDIDSIRAADDGEVSKAQCPVCLTEVDTSHINSHLHDIHGFS